jgi:probable F420-dependent oxidoreductase
VTIELGRFGVWRRGSELSPELAVELEKLGYGTIWIGSSPSGDLRHLEQLLDATSRVVVGTSVVNVWKDDPAGVAEAYHRVEARHPGRFIVGVGIGHPEQSSQYRSPYQTLVDYLDGLDAGGVPVQRRALAALGPKVLELARDRTAGALPYLVPVAHTRIARETLGPDPLLAVEQKVVLAADPERGRQIARPRIQNPYLGLTNYTRNLRKLGYTDEDLAGAGSDRLIDDLALHGTPEAVAAGLTRHLDAGADQVAVQLLTGPGEDVVERYRELADALPR